MHAHTQILALLLAASSAVLADNGQLPRIDDLTIEASTGALEPVSSGAEPPATTSLLSDTATFKSKPWRFSLQQFMRSKHRQDGSVEDFYGTELEIKLPVRIQIGRYNSGDRSGSLGNITAELHYTLANFGNPFASDEAFVELRYSAGAQGAIFLNPQLYTRYILVEDESPILEIKLRLTEKFGDGWRTSATFSLEQETRDAKQTEFTASGRLSKNILDGLFSIGCETKFSNETVRGERGDPDQEFLIGPSIRWRMAKNFAASGSWLFGTTGDSNRSEIFLVIKYDFGGPDDQDFAAPVSDTRN